MATGKAEMNRGRSISAVWFMPLLTPGEGKEGARSFVELEKALLSRLAKGIAATLVVPPKSAME